jgi:hypothetical protein
MVVQQGDHERGHHDVGQGQRDEAAPSEVHQLIVAKTREHPAHPDEDDHEEGHLGEEHPDVDQAQQQRAGRQVQRVDERHRPTTQEERHHHGRGSDHVGVLTQEEERELHGAVFGVVSADEFGLGLRKIEGQTVGLGERRDQEDDEGQRLLEDHPAVLGLIPDDVAQVEALGEEEDRNHTHAHGDLVGDHLSGGADASQKGVLGIGPVARQDDAVRSDRQ